MSEAKLPPFNRRRFLAGASNSAIAISLAPLFQACSDSNDDFVLNQAVPLAYGPIQPVNDTTTGLPLLKLPEGFTYRSFGWTGDIMSDGTLTPDRHDGMAVVSGAGGSGESVLIRNHERSVVEPGQPLPLIGDGLAPVYDTLSLPGLLAGLGGGTTALRMRDGQLIEDTATLAGTLANCAGGPTPWGSWLTCEETITLGSLIGAQDHGYVFEVPDPALGQASAVPITAMGLMEHEALAVDPRDSRVYLTEDNNPQSGFYRFTPNDTSQTVGSLEQGGTLEMLTISGSPNFDLTTALQGDSFAVEWVVIDDPTAGPEDLGAPAPGFPPIVGVGRSGPYLQGEAKGGARMRRGEGCWYQDGVIYVVDTSGGAAGKGQVWAYVPGDEQLTALFVSPDAVTADNPDNVTVTPKGAVIVCEDGGGVQLEDGSSIGTRMIGIGQDGASFVFAENNMLLEAELPGRPFIAPADYRSQEWAGVCFDPAGQYLYVNIQTPGVTFAITGPWERGGF
ncbi:MAG: alkaline phosphatase PhoX [Pseudomonadota bacterium]